MDGASNANGPCNAASRKIEHIALPTKYNYQATSVSRQQIAMQTDKCRLLPLHLINSLLVYYITKFATNTVTNRTD